MVIDVQWQICFICVESYPWSQHMLVLEILCNRWQQVNVGRRKWKSRNPGPELCSRMVRVWHIWRFHCVWSGRNCKWKWWTFWQGDEWTMDNCWSFLPDRDRLGVSRMRDFQECGDGIWDVSYFSIWAIGDCLVMCMQSQHLHSGWWSANQFPRLYGNRNSKWCIPVWLLLLVHASMWGEVQWFWGCIHCGKHHNELEIHGQWYYIQN